MPGRSTQTFIGILAAGASALVCLAAVMVVRSRSTEADGPAVDPGRSSRESTDVPREHGTATELVRDFAEAALNGDWEALNALGPGIAAEGDRAVPLLDDILRDRSDGTEALRQRAAWILGDIGSPSAVAALTGALREEPSEDVRGQIVNGLSKVTGDQGDAAQAALKSVLLAAGEGPDIRRSAAFLLAKRPEPGASGILAELVIGSQDQDVVRWSIEALGFSTHAATASPSLRDVAAGGRDEALRALAVRSLARVQGADSLDVLGVLGDRLRGDDSSTVRRETVLALGEMSQTPESAKLLAEALKSDGDKAVRAAAATALGRPGRTGNLRFLEKAFSSDEAIYVRLKAVEAVGNIGGGQAIAVLGRAVRSRLPAPVRGAARSALRRLGGEGILKEPEAGAKDDDSF